jgi:hypothetical protein
MVDRSETRYSDVPMNFKLLPPKLNIVVQHTSNCVGTRIGSISSNLIAGANLCPHGPTVGRLSLS